MLRTVLIGSLLLMVGCSSPKATPSKSMSAPAAPSPKSNPTAKAVSAAEFGAAWPLTVPSGILMCKGNAILFEDGSSNQRYGVNGSAAQFADIGPIWRANPDPKMVKFVPKASLEPLITEGQKLCGPK